MGCKRMIKVLWLIGFATWLYSSQVLLNTNEYLLGLLSGIVALYSAVKFMLSFK